jgi:hypothetical protein
LFDALEMSDLFWNEVAQRRETGYQVDAVVAAAERTDFSPTARLRPGSYDPATGEAVDPPTELLDYLEYVEGGNG